MPVVPRKLQKQKLSTSIKVQRLFVHLCNSNSVAGLKQLLSRPLLNLIGGILTLGSLLLPWTIIRGSYPVSVFQPNEFVWFVPWMILAGGLASIFSRYGGLVTVTGLILYFVSPPLYFLSTIGSPAPNSLGIGFWLAVIGAGSSIVGPPGVYLHIISTGDLTIRVLCSDSYFDLSTDLV
jgi:hypothetical protein